MLFPILQDIAFLVLGGVGLYGIRVSRMLAQRKIAQQALIGCVFGISFFLVCANVFVDGNQIDLDVGAGALLFAGYLGGLPGALTALIAVAGSSVIGTTDQVVSYFFAHAILVILGVLVRFVIRPGDQTNVPPDAALFCVAGFLLVHVTPLLMSMRELGSDGFIRAAAPAVTGTLSILLMVMIINVAGRFARRVEQFKELNERFSLALEASGMGVFVWRAGQDVLQIDQALIDLLGLHPQADIVAYDGWLTQVHPRDQLYVDRTICDLWEGSVQVDLLEFRWLHATRGVLHLQCKWQTEVDSTGKTICVTGVVLDVSDLRQSLDQTQQAEARLGTIAANLPGVVLSFDLVDGAPDQVLYVSDGCRDIWGKSPSELKSDPEILFQSTPGVQDHSFLKSLSYSAATLSPVTRRIEVETGTQSTVWLDFHADFHRIDARRVRVDAIYLDVTREVETHQELQLQAVVANRAQRQESIGQLTGGIAHDFNNLLAIILGNLEILREDNTDPDQQESIEAAISATNRGADLTRGMLAFAKRAKLEPTSTDVNAIVEDTRKWVERVMPGNIEFDTALDKSVRQVNLDHSALEGALLNLLINGRDAMPDGGKIKVSSAEVTLTKSDLKALAGTDLMPGPYVRLAVTDTGTGISEDILAHVFDPFFTTKGPGKGTGLGLSMVRGFVEQSGGGIEVKNLDIGCQFSMFFPIMGQVVPLPNVPLDHLPAAEHRFSGQKVLFVEDEPDVRLIVRRMLEDFGLNVVTASSGRQAVDLFEKDPDIDLLLSDLMMPGEVQGADVVRVVRERRPEVPVVVMSGYGADHIQTVDANARLTKPASRKKLRGVLEELVAMNPSRSYRRENE